MKRNKRRYQQRNYKKEFASKCLQNCDEHKHKKDTSEFKKKYDV